MTEKVFTIQVHLQPGAKENALVGWMGDGTLKIRIKAKPVEGKANNELVKFLSDELNVPKDQIEITTGAKSRKKLLKIHGMDREAFNRMMVEKGLQEP